MFILPSVILIYTRQWWYKNYSNLQYKSLQIWWIFGVLLVRDVRLVKLLHYYTRSTHRVSLCLSLNLNHKMWTQQCGALHEVVAWNDVFIVYPKKLILLVDHTRTTMQDKGQLSLLKVWSMYACTFDVPVFTVLSTAFMAALAQWTWMFYYFWFSTVKIQGQVLSQTEWA